MELKEFVEKTLLDIANGIAGANAKMTKQKVIGGKKVIFTLLIQAGKETNTEGGLGLAVKLLTIGAKSGNTSKDEVNNTVTFEVFFEDIEEPKDTGLPKFKINQ